VAARRALASLRKSGSELQAQLQALGVAGVLAYGASPPPAASAAADSLRVASPQKRRRRRIAAAP
jgi:hypothetical protein